MTPQQVAFVRRRVAEGALASWVAAGMHVEESIVNRALRHGPAVNDDRYLSVNFPGHDERLEAHRRRVEKFLREHPEDDYNEQKAAERRELQERAIAMRAAGMTTQEIADKLGLSKMTVRKYVRDDAA